DTIPFAKEHFRMIDNSIYKYDFHLESISSARGIADKEYSQKYPFDADSIARPTDSADAGCYEYRPQEEKE
ncbi:MAG: right-handed parallel beta-helix repeat-containing protein, partial [Bacteroidaceae bacterium]|nr:right-handed parallel beta-helix repeat-containing protein [Bacteroidaceae bacterium]